MSEPSYKADIFHLIYLSPLKMKLDIPRLFHQIHQSENLFFHVYKINEKLRTQCPRKDLQKN